MFFLASVNTIHYTFHLMFFLLHPLSQAHSLVSVHNIIFESDPLLTLSFVGFLTHLPNFSAHFSIFVFIFLNIKIYFLLCLPSLTDDILGVATIDWRSRKQGIKKPNTHFLFVRSKRFVLYNIIRKNIIYIVFSSFKSFVKSIL